jgi:serine/threonine-protein kinase
MNAPKTIEKIGRYKVLDRVGKGGMGVLYRGFDPVLDREVAIKLMHADFSEDTEQMRPRFYREARAAAKLQHRNIVTIFEFAEESNIPYIVMEFLRGTALGARMNAQPPLTLDDKLNIVAQLCDGLSYAHDQGVVHRDVKPDNVFLLEDGSVKLLDFGIAKLTTSTLTRQGDVLGSASYMSPEQVGGSESVDGRADVFSTGVVLYELLCGKKPFRADSPTAVIVKILKDDPIPIESETSDVPPEVIAAVNKALQKDPANRFQSAEALGRELQSIRKNLRPAIPNLDETRFASTQVMRALHDDYQRGRGTGSTTGTAVSPAAVPSGKTNSRMIPALAGGVVLVAAIAGIAVYSRSDTPPASAARTAPPSSAPASPGVSSTAASPAPAAAADASNGAPAAPANVAVSAAATTAQAPPAPTRGNPPAAAGKATTDTRRAAAPAPPPAPALVPVTLSGTYPFAVYDGSTSISAPSTTHELKVGAGKALRLQAPQYFLNQTVRVEGSTNQPFDYAAPGLGGLDVRSNQETCEISIGGRSLGNPPLVVREIAAGAYKVDLVCAGEVSRSQTAIVRAGQTSVVPIR